jgi:cell division transport system permease protein
MASATARIPVVSSLVNISLILFFLGIFVFLALAGQRVLDLTLQSLRLKLVLPDHVTAAEAQSLADSLSSLYWVQSVDYVSKEQALKLFDTGEDFLAAMDGANPLPATLQIQLQPQSIEPQFLSQTSRELLELPQVIDIYYPIQQIDNILANAARLQVLALVVGAVLLFIALLLIVNTIRLAIYSKRMVIRSMQLIGATSSFIRWPFVRLGLVQGALGGLVASALILALIFILERLTELDLSLLLQGLEIKLLFLGLILIGTVLGWLSSRIAVNRFLDRSIDSLA